ncbi:DinB family protein [Eionea flava]
MLDELVKLLKYKSWANNITFSALSSVDDVELYKNRQTHFKNILMTLNHVYVVDDIFKSHLLSKKHGYSSRNTDTCSSFSRLWEQQKVIDNWYIDFISALEEGSIADQINFEFVGGGDGTMSIAEIVFHIVNHGTYHRGFVSDLMYQIPVTPPANDMTVYLRDIYKVN